MGKLAVPAPDRQVTGAYYHIMRAGNMTITARGILHQFPDMVLPDFCQSTRRVNILYAGDKDPCCPAVVAGYLSLVRDRLDNLIGILLAMIAVRTIFRKDEPVAHGIY